MTTEQKDKMAQGRERAKQERAAERLMSTGIGESRVFADPDAPQEDSRLLDSHINGKRIRDLGFTPLQLSALSWHITDEGIAARNEGKSEIRASVTSDPLAKSMQKRKDDVLERGMETWEAENAMKEQTAQYGKPGFRNRYLSDGTVKLRGMRGWQPVRGENGDPVKLGTMVLAEMPEAKAEARNRSVRAAGDERLKQVTEKYMDGAQGSAVTDQ